MNTAPRKLLLPLCTFVLAAALLAACGGGDDDDDGGNRGQLSDPNNVPTASPWVNPPEVLILDPNNLPTLPPSDPGSGSEDEATPVPGEPGVCGDTYTVEAGDTTFGIADKCGVSVEGIEELNPDIDIRALTIGDVLNLPPAEEEPAPEEEVAPEEIAPEEAAPDEQAPEEAPTEAP